MSGAVAAVVMGGRAPGVITSSLPAGSNVGSCDYQFDNTGAGHTGDGAGGALAFGWVTPQTATVAAFYEVRVDVTSGAFTSGPATGVYLDMATTRQWIKSAIGTVVFTVTFREKASLTVRRVLPGISITVS